MPLSLFFAASALLHPRPVLHISRARLTPHVLRRDLLPLTDAMATDVKGEIQFIKLVPAADALVPTENTPPPRIAPPRIAPPLMPLKPALSVDSRAQVVSDEQDLIAAINTERQEQGLQPLTIDPLLTETARAHSREMADLNYFDHRSPVSDEKTPLSRYIKSLHEWGERKPDTALVGENLFYCSATTETYNMAYAHESLMHSPGHRANILEARYTKVGVGLYRDSQGRFWVTEMFLRDS